MPVVQQHVPAVIAFTDARRGIAGASRAILADGANLASNDAGRTWHVAAPVFTFQGAPCPYDEIRQLAPPLDQPVAALCAGAAGAGNQEKAVYRLRNSRWVRVAWGLASGSSGGLTTGGYPLGLSVAGGGFGLTCRSRSRRATAR